MADSQSYIRAKAFRHQMSPPEARIWVQLRASRFHGWKFRRQHPVGPYILDFFCVRAQLAIEVDGRQHYEEAQAEHDRRRTRWLAGRGIAVLRIAAVDVRDNLPDVMDWLERVLRKRLTSAPPPPGG